MDTRLGVIGLGVLVLLVAIMVAGAFVVWPLFINAAALLVLLAVAAANIWRQS